MNIALTFKPHFLLGLRAAGALLVVTTSSQVMAKTPQTIYASECSE
jgi:hypothetical protein